MAEAFFNQYAPEGVKALSAGTQPAQGADPTMVQAMREVGIDISGKVPKQLTPEMLQNAERVITMGCLDEAACPAPWVPSEDWGLEDPHGQPVTRVREIRDQIRDKVIELLKRI